ncbi:MAG: hypothetical protein E7J86_21690, partial [Aeromonas caviae]|nr:hypothetical protein [Aeromonas caviae]
MTTEIPLVLVTEGNVQATTFTTYLMAQLGEPIRLISHPDQLLAIENGVVDQIRRWMAVPQPVDTTQFTGWRTGIPSPI